jgi:hypothetical protein
MTKKDAFGHRLYCRRQVVFYVFVFRPEGNLKMYINIER